MDIETQHDNLYWIHLAFKTRFISCLFYTASIFYLIFWGLFDINPIISVLLIAVMKSVLLFITFKTAKASKCENLRIFEIICEILFLILLFPVCFDQYELIYAGIPIYIENIILSLVTYKNPSNFAVFNYLLSTLIRWSFTISFICFALRLQGNLGWNWFFVFWPIWILVILGIFIGVIYMFLIGIIRFKREIDIFGPTWMVLSLLSFSVGLIIFILGVCDKLSNSENSELIRGCSIFSGILVMQLIVTFNYSSSITSWLQAIFSHEEEPSPMLNNVQRALKTFTQTINLLKISSTLYRENPANAHAAEKAEKSKSNNSVKECLICCEDECNGVIFPCGHSGVCYNCAVTLLQLSKPCHICREPITRVLKINKDDNQVIIATEIGPED